MKIYIICPVRKISAEWRDGLLAYTHMLEKQGHTVHLPFRDTDQNDRTGFNICQNHAEAMAESDEVHVAYDGVSEWLFDLGMAFILKKPVQPITGYFPNANNKGKSYVNMVWDWNAQSHDF